METQSLLTLIGGVMLGIISYFLKETMNDLKKVKEKTYQNATKLEVLEAEYMLKINNLSDKFDMLYESMKDLTVEIKRLNNKIKT